VTRTEMLEVIEPGPVPLEPHAVVEVQVVEGLSADEASDVAQEIASVAEQVCEAPVEPDVRWIVRPLERPEPPAFEIDRAVRTALTHAASGVLGGVVVAAALFVLMPTARSAPAQPIVPSEAKPTPPVALPVNAAPPEVSPALHPAPQRIRARPVVVAVQPPAPAPEPEAEVSAQPPPVQAVAPSPPSDEGTDEEAAPAAEVATEEEAALPPVEAPAEKLTLDQIASVIEANQAQVTDCVSAEKGRHPSASGRLMLSWSILPNGEAADIGAENPAVAPVLTDCLENAILDWTFPEHAGEAQPVRRAFAF
jgi:hypothetical protein